MHLKIKKPTGGKLVKGRDHRLKYTMTWDDDTHPNLTNDIDAIYVTVKASDALADDLAVIAFNSVDNPDQFITVDAANGQGKIWIKKDDQDAIIPDTVQYCMDIVVIVSDGTEWEFVLDNNIMFTQPATRETGYGLP